MLIRADANAHMILQQWMKLIHFVRFLAGYSGSGLQKWHRPRVYRPFCSSQYPRLWARDIIDINVRLKQLHDFKAQIWYIVHKPGCRLSLCSLPATSFNVSSLQSYGKSGVVTGLVYDATEGSNQISTEYIGEAASWGRWPTLRMDWIYWLKLMLMTMDVT